MSSISRAHAHANDPPHIERSATRELAALSPIGSRTRISDRGGTPRRFR
jgi:hypothetical protein